MSLVLDDRQRAMLAEMNIRVWAPPVTQEIAAAIAAVPAPTGGRETPAHPAQPLPESRPQPPRPAHPPLSGDRLAGIAAMDWPALQSAVAGCTACKLCESRRNTVFGVGQPPAAAGAAPRADWLVVGEAPGENEDLQGEPFVGQAGLLLDNMLRALSLERTHNVFITNVLKCRPPGNRNPEPGEVVQCEPFLRRQIELVQPKMILAMGRFAVQSLLQTSEPIGKLRGRAHAYHGVPVVVTYHPAYLLRTLPDKARAWADLCLAASLLSRSG